MGIETPQTPKPTGGNPWPPRIQHGISLDAPTGYSTLMLQRYLLVWLTALSVVAYLWPTSGIGWDPFAASAAYLPHLFAATMFAIGCLLPRDEIRQVLMRWPTVFGGTAVQYTVMPLTAYTIGHLCGLQGSLLLGVILVGCVPGAMASNVLTLAAKGNVSYSVSLTTAATLLSPVVVPVVLLLTVQQTAGHRGLLAQRAFWILATQVVGPVVTGHLLARRFRRLEETMKTVGPVIANLAILWIIAGVVNLNHEKLAQTGGQLAGILIAVNGIGYLAGFTAGTAFRLPDTMRRALTLEIGMQNAGLGAVLAGQLFAEDPITSLPPALYTFGCMLTGTVLAQLWALRSVTAAQEDGALASGSRLNGQAELDG